MRKVIVRLLLLAVLMLPSCEHYKMQKRIAAFEAEMEDYRAQTDNVGLCVVYVRDNEVAYKKQWGLKRIESEEIMPDGTVKRSGPAMDDEVMMRCASISKTFTATGLMQLVEKGDFGLRMDVGEVLDKPIRNPKFPDTVITL